MSIECIDGRYFVGVWFLALGDDVDHMATVYRDGPGKEWVLKSRVAVTISKDHREKRWLNGKMPADWTEERVIATLDQAYDGMKLTNAVAKAAGMSVRFCRVLMQSDSAEKNSRVLIEQPWTRVVDTLVVQGDPS